MSDTTTNTLINLELVNLTTPEPKTSGSLDCKTYNVGEFPHNDFFKNHGVDGLELWAPTKGASSKSTSRTRTELREMTAQNKVFNWSYGDANDHFLQATLTVNQAPKNSQETVVGQIHVHDSSKPPLKLSWDKGRVILGFREAFEQTNPVDYVLLSDVPLGVKWSYSIHVTRSGSVSVVVKCADVSATKSLRLQNSWEKAGLYFKAGLYNQEDPTDNTSVSEGSKALFHNLTIRHEGYSRSLPIQPAGFWTRIKLFFLRWF